MRVRWYGQSAFALTGADTRVFVDPFGDMSALAARGWQFEYPAIEGAEADLLLVTQTTDGAQARAIVDRLAPRWVVPMHYRTGRAPFLEEPADGFLASFGDAVHRAATPEFDTAGLPPDGGPLAVVPAVP